LGYIFEILLKDLVDVRKKFLGRLRGEGLMGGRRRIYVDGFFEIKLNSFLLKIYLNFNDNCMYTIKIWKIGITSHPLGLLQLLLLVAASIISLFFIISLCFLLLIAISLTTLRFLSHWFLFQFGNFE
jgi:hypothetical protein